MKRLSSFALLALSALALCAVAARAQTATPLPHRRPIAQPANQLFEQLKTGFSGGRFGPYVLLGSDARTLTVVAKRSAIDVANWARWAYCPMGPIDLLDSLRDGSVTLTVKLEPTKGPATWAVVWADFTGTYGIAASSKQVQCSSTGVLEEDILHQLGAATS